MPAKPDDKAIGDRIRKVRVNKGISVPEFAARLGFSDPRTVYKLEGGQSKIGVRRVYAVADVLGINPSWLLYGTGRGPGAALPPPAAPPHPISGPAAEGFVAIPIKGSVKGGAPTDIINPGDETTSFLDARGFKPTAYALRVVGDSMSPTAPDGSIAVVEPYLPPVTFNKQGKPSQPLPKSGRAFVIAKAPDSYDYTVKVLTRDAHGGDYYLVPINPGAIAPIHLKHGWALTARVRAVELP